MEISRMTRPTVVTAFLLCVTGLLPHSVYANCTVQSDGLAFGSYDPLRGNPVDGVGTITLQCSEATGYTVHVGPGQAGFQPREMSQVDGNAVLQFNLFTDPGRESVWGDGTGTTSVVGGIAGIDGTSHTIYGRIFGNQNVPAGSYRDTIVITVSY